MYERNSETLGDYCYDNSTVSEVYWLHN